MRWSARGYMRPALAANQGVYNGFLAAGLIWGLVHPVAGFGFQIKVFFLLCVIVAGIYGAACGPAQAAEGGLSAGRQLLPGALVRERS